MHMTREQFETAVVDALEELPPKFSSLLENIVVVVEDEPTEEDLDLLDDGDEEDELLGIYRGTPRTERSHDMSLLPDQIAIFRGPILRCVESRRQAIEEIRDTVIHELGHYFGLDDDHMVY